MGDQDKGKDICERTFEFAVRVVALCRCLDSAPGAGRVLGKQLIRAGTSVGANIEEAQAGQSKADFISKTAIALKEAREAAYWLRLIAAAEVMPRDRLSALQTEAEEITRVLAAIIVSAKRNI